MSQFVMPSMAAQKAKRISDQRKSRKVLRGHVLPWSFWQMCFPSFQGLNRQDVRIIALATGEVFQHATGSTSYLSAMDIFRLRRELRKQAVMKKQLIPLRLELIQKTHGWLLDEGGAVRMKNQPGSTIAVEIERILSTLRIFEERSINIERALTSRQLR